MNRYVKSSDIKTTESGYSYNYRKFRVESDTIYELTNEAYYRIGSLNGRTPKTAIARFLNIEMAN